jgi:2-dehydropantoate 2-reductase
MKIAIYGAGAIGGYIAALLTQSGEEVSVIARGPHLAAIKANGLALDMNGERIITHPVATDNPADLGEQDFVIVSLKATIIGREDGGRNCSKWSPLVVFL